MFSSPLLPFSPTPKRCRMACACTWVRVSCSFLDCLFVCLFFCGGGGGRWQWWRWVPCRASSWGEGRNGVAPCTTAERSDVSTVRRSILAAFWVFKCTAVPPPYHIGTLYVYINTSIYLPSSSSKLVRIKKVGQRAVSRLVHVRFALSVGERYGYRLHRLSLLYDIL